MYKTFYSMLMVKTCEYVEREFVGDLSEDLRIITEMSPECKLEKLLFASTVHLQLKAKKISFIQIIRVIW